MRPQGNCKEMQSQRVILESRCKSPMRGVGVLGIDKARYWAATDLKTGFGGMRLGCLDVGVTLASRLASCLSCARC
jgi:hypothetical protein